MTSPDSSSPVPHVTRPRSRVGLWLLGLLLLGLAAVGTYYWQRNAPPRQVRGRFGPSDQPVPVRVVRARTDTIQVELPALGTVTPLQTVTVRSRVDGQLVQVLFTEGQHVAKGQLLALIDPHAYESALTQAQGSLNESRARLKNAQSDLATYQRLAAEGLITRQQVTTQEALVQQYSGNLEAGDAQVNTAKIQLAYTRITAPIDGRLGLRQVDAGNLIRSGDVNGLVTISQMHPISVLYTVPEADLPSVLAGQRKGKPLRVEAWDRADQKKLADGSLRTVDNQIDPATGTIKLRAEFANDGEVLFPNQFVNIRMRVNTLQDATVIPSAAVQRASFGPFVYVVRDNGTVTIRRIGLGPTQGDRVAVLSGLQADERIVLEGVDDLVEGAKVEVIKGSDEGNSETPAPAQPPAQGPRGAA